MKQHLATIHSQQMYSTWSKKCVADIWNTSSDNYHLFHWGRDKLASFECSFNLNIIIVTHCGCLWSAGWGCTGFWMCVRLRWSSALCCCSSRPAARGSTGDARYPPVIWRSSGRTEGEKHEGRKTRGTTDVRRIVRKDHVEETFSQSVITLLQSTFQMCPKQSYHWK